MKGRRGKKRKEKKRKEKRRATTKESIGGKNETRTLEQHSKDPQLDLPFSKPTVQRPQRFVLLMSLL